MALYDGFYFYFYFLLFFIQGKILHHNQMFQQRSLEKIDIALFTTHS